MIDLLLLSIENASNHLLLGVRELRVNCIVFLVTVFEFNGYLCLCCNHRLAEGMNICLSLVPNLIEIKFKPPEESVLSILYRLF